MCKFNFCVAHTPVTPYAMALSMLNCEHSSHRVQSVYMSVWVRSVVGSFAVWSNYGSVKHQLSNVCKCANRKTNSTLALAHTTKTCNMRSSHFKIYLRVCTGNTMDQISRCINMASCCCCFCCTQCVHFARWLFIIRRSGESGVRFEQLLKYWNTQLVENVFGSLYHWVNISWLWN